MHNSSSQSDEIAQLRDGIVGSLLFTVFQKLHDSLRGLQLSRDFEHLHYELVMTQDGLMNVP